MIPAEEKILVGARPEEIGGINRISLPKISNSLRSLRPKYAIRLMAIFSAALLQSGWTRAGVSTEGGQIVARVTPSARRSGANH
jgi:hypothetical protein